MKDEQLNKRLQYLVKHTDLCPERQQEILIALTLLVTTGTVPLSFSTMRRVKTWLRSTMADDRLSGLCMMSIHRAKIDENKHLIEKVIDKFAQVHRHLQFLFRDH